MLTARAEGAGRNRELEICHLDAITYNHVKGHEDPGMHPEMAQRSRSSFVLPMQSRMARGSQTRS